MTDAEFELLCRSWLNDKDVDFWTGPDFTAYKAAALVVVTSKWWNLLEDFRGDYQDYDVPATNRLLDLPANCQKILRIETTETGDKLLYAWRNELFYWMKMTPGDPIRWRFRGGKVQLYPITGAAKTGYIRFWFIPRADTLAALPVCLHPVIAMEVVMMARVKDEHIDQGIVMELQRFEDAARKDLVQSQAQEPYIEKMFNMDEIVEED